MTIPQSGAPAASLVRCMQQLLSEGLTTGTNGNASLRSVGGMLITPTGIRPAELMPESVVAMDLGGNVASSQLAPSSEWPMHAAIYHARPDVHAIVHCHSHYATSLACNRLSIPAFHYLVALAGGDSIPCAPYATFGSDELGRHVAGALRERHACLIANHGQVTVGTDLESALELARRVEEMAAQYHACLSAGGPVLLTKDEMNDIRSRISGYGQPKRTRTGADE
jgi:L-fuculose-phosphate aldolase